MSFGKALIIGQSGQVSQGLAAALKGREVVFTSSSGRDGAIRLDLGDGASVRAGLAEAHRRLGAGVEVFLSGAMTHVDRCEQEQERCRLVNWEGPALVAQICREMKWGLTYFSTEYVFGGDEYEGGAVGPFGEEDPPHPTSYYGRCKWEAEKAVQRVYGGDALIVRTTMVFSWDPAGMNFLMQYLRQLEDHSAGRAKPFRIPVDQISTPAYAPTLARNTVALRDMGLGGIFHLVDADLLSRRELAERVAEEFGYGAEAARAAFQYVNTAELGQAARRPLTAGLRADKARAAGLKIGTLTEALADAKRLKTLKG